MPARQPDWSAAVVPDAKLRDYLLAADHPEGGPKAAFFLSVHFSASDLAAFAYALRRQASFAVVSSAESRYGVKFIADGPILSPSGSEPWIRSVWILEPGSEAPRFVTAYPLEAKHGDR